MTSSDGSVKLREDSVRWTALVNYANAEVRTDLLPPNTTQNPPKPKKKNQTPQTHHTKTHNNPQKNPKKKKKKKPPNPYKNRRKVEGFGPEWGRKPWDNTVQVHQRFKLEESKGGKNESSHPGKWCRDAPIGRTKRGYRIGHPSEDRKTMVLMAGRPKE